MNTEHSTSKFQQLYTTQHMQLEFEHGDNHSIGYGDSPVPSFWGV